MKEMNHNNELGTLILKAIKGDAAPEEIELLGHLLEGQPENVAFYYDFISIYARLSRPDFKSYLSHSLLPDETDNPNESMPAACVVSEARTDSAPLSEDHLLQEIVSRDLQQRMTDNDTSAAIQPTDRWSSRTRKPVTRPDLHHVLTALARIAAIFFFAAAIILADRFFRTADSSSLPDYAATITDEINAQWKDQTKPGDFGDHLFAADGYRRLQGGFIKLAFVSGAEVVIESPAEFQILSANRLSLKQGRAYARVPEQATGFTVLTPGSEVIDLGTEFGVDVQNDQSTAVHVVKGKTSLISRGDADGERVNLTAGKAVKTEKNGRRHDITMNKNNFTRDISSRMGLIYRGDEVINVGRWQLKRPALFPDDLRNDGRLVRACNLGMDAQEVYVNGIHFDTRVDNIRGGKKWRDEKNSPGHDVNETRNLLNTAMVVNNNEYRQVAVWLSDLEVGRKYRLQLLIGFGWNWCDVNLYGIKEEYIYFPDPHSDKTGLATYCWKADAENGRIVINSPHDENHNLCKIFGYVLHELDDEYVIWHESY